MISPIKNLFTALALSAGLVAAGGWLASELSWTASTVGRATAVVEGAAPARQLAYDGLHVETTGIRSNRGSIIVAVYNDPDALAQYDDQRVVGYAEVPATAGAVSVDFPDLGTGPYAVTVFHDENGDRDFNMEGDWPLEGYGTSGAMGPYDEPSFERAAVMPGRVSVPIHYLR